MDESNQPVARLRWNGGDFLLCPGQRATIGRSPENDIVIDDPKVSRVHAEIVWNGARFSLHDLGSANGTFVNTARLSDAPRLLRDGDDIYICQQILVYEIIRADAAEWEGEPAQPRAGEGRPAGPYLMVSAGPDMGQVYPLWGEVITIGRASREATWEIRLTDRAVSRPHARIERTNGDYFLSDLNSANGTLLNGSLISEPQAVISGDVITVGETQMVFFET